MPTMSEMPVRGSREGAQGQLGKFSGGGLELEIKFGAGI